MGASCCKKKKREEPPGQGNEKQDKATKSSKAYDTEDHADKTQDDLMSGNKAEGKKDGSGGRKSGSKSKKRRSSGKKSGSGGKRKSGKQEEVKREQPDIQSLNLMSVQPSGVSTKR